MNTDEDKEIYGFIERECEKAGVTVDRVLSSERKKELAAMRRHLSIELKKRYDLTQASIAKKLNLTVCSVSGYFKTLNNTNQKKIDPPSQPKPSTINRPSDFFVIDFTDHGNLYNHLIKYAKDQLRTPQDQILFMLKQEIKLKENGS